MQRRWRSTAIKAYRQASLKEPGAIAVDIFQETGHPSRFIISEVWRDHAAFVARANSPAGPELFAKVKPVEFRPPDIRIHFLFAGTTYKAPTAGNVMIISHLDACCGGTPTLEAAMKSLGRGRGEGKGHGALTRSSTSCRRAKTTRVCTKSGRASGTMWRTISRSRCARCTRGCRNISARRTTNGSTGW